MYVVECSDGTYYTGFTTHVAARVSAHNLGKGAKYTRSRLPVRLVAYACFETRNEALSAEFHFKKLTRAEKEAVLFREDRALAETGGQPRLDRWRDVMFVLADAQ